MDLCTNCSKRAQNPGRRWCEKCFKKSVGGQTSKPAKQFCQDPMHPRTPDAVFCSTCGGKIQKSKKALCNHDPTVRLDGDRSPTPGTSDFLVSSKNLSTQHNKHGGTGPQCSRGCGNPANPGRAWCQQCWDASLTTKSHTTKSSHHHSGGSGQCSRAGCGNFANPGHPWCQQCWKASQSSVFTSLAPSTFNINATTHQGFPTTFQPPPVPKSSTTPCLVCGQAQFPNSAFCLKCWKYASFDYTTLCSWYMCVDSAQPGTSFCLQHQHIQTPKAKLLKFYDKDKPFYQFTNFFAAPLEIMGKTWNTSEEFFQAMKFHHLTIHKLISSCDLAQLSSIREWKNAMISNANSFGLPTQDQPTQFHSELAQCFSPTTPVSEVVRTLGSPRAAFEFARKWSKFVTPDWHIIKFSVMHYALCIKFSTHPDLKALLVGTVGEALIEHTKNDRCWADNGDGTGTNWLGKLLMIVREGLVASFDV